uniref:Uncharacterized protein n=1 Tax=Zooxanthella nutricula TaxID=1333877 RepID=A0A6U6NMQ4_9DINO|mmetsp:Transcript_50780/g.154456  ORF Transcript_50780/g.154456 Transcript_50780/m.154456 type:complete len:150 (+) Transcript_50780:75-524(+)
MSTRVVLALAACLFAPTAAVGGGSKAVSVGRARALRAQGLSHRVDDATAVLEAAGTALSVAGLKLASAEQAFLEDKLPALVESLQAAPNTPLGETLASFPADDLKKVVGALEARGVSLDSIPKGALEAAEAVVQKSPAQLWAKAEELMR